MRQVRVRQVRVRQAQRQQLAGIAVALALLVVLAATVGLSALSWVIGLGCGAAVNVLLARARSRVGDVGPFPADRVTLARATLVAGVAAVLADPARRTIPLAIVVALSSVALALDAVDGYVARRTATASAVGARFDMEIDALLILVLSIGVTRHYGSWVLAIGLARYALLVAGRLLPWLDGPVPSRYWRKVVAAVQGVVLTVALSGLVPHSVATVALVVALLLLAESFGRDVRWLYRTNAGATAKRVVRLLTSVVAGVVVWVAFAAPDRLDKLSPAALVRIPLEGLALVAVAVAVPARIRRVLAVVAGIVLGVLGVVKILDMGFYEELGRPFNPIIDWGNLGPAVGVVRDSIGRGRTDLLVAGAVVVLVAVVAVVTWAVARVCAVAAGRRSLWVRGRASVAGLSMVGVAAAIGGFTGLPIASTTTAAVAATQVRDAEASVVDEQRFQTALHADDAMAQVPTSRLLTALRGKDVIVVFVESYGQVAVSGTAFSPGVDAVANAGTRDLRAAGYGAKSAFLVSPTFGGISWLAHSTLQSGLWINNQARYDELVGSKRFTLATAFRKAGWHTVADVPSDVGPWPQGSSFYHYDEIYNRDNVGYAGPKFSYASMPDQYTLAAFQRAQLGAGHRPVMAEIDLVSSHTPWTPLPRMVPWAAVGDGSVFDPMPAQGRSPAVVWRHRAQVQRLYGESVQYSLQALTSWVTNLHDKNLVLVMLGDHQPSTTVSGAGANHDVPISIVAHDPAVLDAIASWGWQDGLLPGSDAPLWPMDAFRDRFLTAYSAGDGTH